jgi:hypothetical protein
MKYSLLLRISLMLAIYLAISYFGGEIGRKLTYPIRLLVTFLHEFGHASGALLTGGSVENVQINPDGSGFTRTAGGSRAIILMGGYLGSALLGNLLLFIGARAKTFVNIFSILLAVAMLTTSIIWYNSMFTSITLMLFAGIIILVTLKTRFARDILLFLGLTSILYIIQDFNVGPSSDLSHYAEVMGLFPPQVWMYIWLGLAVLLLIFNIRLIIKLANKGRRNQD